MKQHPKLARSPGISLGQATYWRNHIRDQDIKISFAIRDLLFPNFIESTMKILDNLMIERIRLVEFAQENQGL